jgi:hypothetical protein
MDWIFKPFRMQATHPGLVPHNPPCTPYQKLYFHGNTSTPGQDFDTPLVAKVQIPAESPDLDLWLQLAWLKTGNGLNY